MATRAIIAKLANEGGGPRITAASDADALLDWLRWNNNGPVEYDHEKHDDPSTPLPDVDELWDEIENHVT